MHKIYLVIWVWFCLVLSVMAMENFIVLAHGNNEIMNLQQKKYEELARQNLNINSEVSIEHMASTSILQVGPFERNDVLAISYMILKESFPDAVIVEKNRPVVIPKPFITTVEKKVYIDKEVVVEKVDETLWTALFGLAIVGVLFMFLSSDKIKRLKEEHEKIKSKHKKLEQRQHEVLSSMGENIHTIARETMNYTSRLAEKIKETPLYDDIEQVIYNENELLDVTGDLIKFLRLKSKKVVIQHEVFNFNHVLNEVAGLLNNTYKQNNTELVFDIDKEVPRYMLSDSLHLGQILINLLEYFIQNSKSKEIKLEVKTLSSFKDGLQLRFQIDGDIVIEDKEILFDSYYDEKSRRYVGLGLFVAKELTHLMDGELLVVERKDGRNSLVFAIPIEEKDKEKRKYRLPDKGLVGKKILLVDKSSSAAKATKKLFAYFRTEITVLTAEKFGKNIPNFANYDIVALNIALFNFKIQEILKEIKKTQPLKIISLDNLFSSDDRVLNDIVDISLKKPLTQEYVFDTLVKLYEEKEENFSLDENKVDSNKLFVYRKPFKDAQNITLESFKTFKGAYILIVEDNIINQKVVMSVLGKSEMTMYVANNGKEAVEFMQNTSENIDFIFMDINMPVMDGYRATKLIRNDKRFNNIAIVALTALVSEHEIVKMFHSGMNGYLPKPVRIEKLYSALEIFLTKKEIPVPTIDTIENKPMKYEGLDINDGLNHMKENDIFYKEVLKEFMDAYIDSDTVFEKLVNEQRFAQVQMLCLDMKGLTETIGAKEMHVVINEIHLHLIYKKTELLHGYVSRYRETFTILIKSIKMYLAT